MDRVWAMSMALTDAENISILKLAINVMFRLADGEAGEV